MNKNIPRHLAIVMDGNGRWAKARGCSRIAGHKAGVKATKDIVYAALDRGIEYLSLFAFSSENWRRPRFEINALMTLFQEVLQTEVEELMKNDIRLQFIGSRENMGMALHQLMQQAEELTEHNSKMTVMVAMDYGGRWDIVTAAKRLAEKVSNKELTISDVDEACFNSLLSTADLPEVDCLIRTSGEQRLSNYFLWQSAYTELCFVRTLWPDFNADDLDEALASYARRERRFGHTSEQMEPQCLEDVY